jgi:hypothetical protein
MLNDEQGVTQPVALSEVAGQDVRDGAQAARLSVTVLFTTVPATLSALREGAKLAHELGARVRVLVPSVVPYPLELDRPRVDPLFRLRHFRALWDEVSVETFIDVRLCRDQRRCIHDALPPHSLVLIGTPARSWRLASEKLLAKDLRHEGHEVILVETRSEPSVRDRYSTASREVCPQGQEPQSRRCSGLELPAPSSTCRPQVKLRPYSGWRISRLLR